MDASEFATRELTSWGDWSQGGRFETLAYRCGNPERRIEADKERYVANIGKNAWGPRWKVVMEVEQDDIAITWSHDGGAIPPPPPGQSMAGASPNASCRLPVFGKPVPKWRKSGRFGTTKRCGTHRRMGTPSCAWMETPCFSKLVSMAVTQVVSATAMLRHTMRPPSFGAPSMKCCRHHPPRNGGEWRIHTKKPRHISRLFHQCRAVAGYRSIRRACMNLSPQ